MNALDALIMVGSCDPNPEIHLVDIENFCGRGKVSGSDVALAKALYKRAVKPSKSAIFCIAAGPQNPKAVYEGWGAALYQ